MFRIRSLAVAALFGALTALPGAAFAEGEVNLYSSRHYATDDALYKEFTRQTGIKVNVVQAGGGELIQRIQREGENSPADLFLTEDAGVIGRVHLAGLLQPVKSAALEAAIPANLREHDGHWFGLTMRARVIMYHKDRVKPSELSTYEDLSTAKWKKRILVRSSTSAYNQSLVVSLMEADGVAKTELWAKGIVANLAREPKGGDRDQITAVMAGEGDIAISNTYYLGHLLKDAKAGEYAKLGVFFPNQGDRGTHVNISGGGVLKHAPHKDNAVKFLEFLLTPEAQKVFAEANFEYPVRKGVEISPTIKAFGEFKADPLSVGVLAKRNQEAVQLMDRAGWK
ncbi:MAG TPA: Fe(3+) ABC transporter substrate-binding protein [Alphaproteobacteria bacterium]|nr:Fe(3+) ABC transporter substrate-binding protein [Alphaproteobacteria bacterium]